MRLYVNIDHVATVRQARRTDEPDPVRAAVLAELVRSVYSIEILKPLEMDGEGWLLLDDLVDTGQTAQKVRDMLPKAHFATVYAKPQGRPLVDTFITEVSQDTWILFPWDAEPAYVQPIASGR